MTNVERTAAARDGPTASAQPTGTTRATGTTRPTGVLVPVLLAVAVAAAVAVPLALVLSPIPGTDGAAQVARADFWSAHPWRPLDLRWYGGVSGWGYSLLTPPLVATLGIRLAALLCAVAAAGALAVLLVRADVRRPRLGAVVGGIAACSNLPTGRSAFALGTALGLLTLVVATLPTNAAVGGRRVIRDAAATLLAALTAVASPVAGLFLGLAGVAWALAGMRRRSADRRPDSPRALPLVLAVTAGACLLAMQLRYGDGGRMPFSWATAWRPALAALAVAVLAERRHRALLFGALIYAAGVMVTYRMPGALGSNVERLALLLAAPLLVATAVLPTLRTGAAAAPAGGPWRRPVTAALVLVATLTALNWQAKVPLRDLRNAGAELPASAYAPLLAALGSDRTGRVEVVPLRNHGEAAVVARSALLARGWDRQVDVGENSLLYRSPLDPETYRAWLADRAVRYVALADAPLDWSAGPEAALLDRAPSYLAPVPVGGPWRLWRVVDPGPFVTAPARVVSADAAGVTVRADGPATAVLRLRWSPLLTVSSGQACLAPGPSTQTTGADEPEPAPGHWVLIRFRAAGQVRVTSTQLPGASACA